MIRMGIALLFMIAVTGIVFAQHAQQSVQHQLPQPPEVMMREDLIEMYAEPSTIIVNNISSSKIAITVYYPEDLPLVGGEPAVTRVDVSTDIGTLIDAENETNRGKSITVYTNESGNAVVIFASTEEGTVNVTARAPLIEYTLEPISVVQNSTELRVKERVEETTYGWRFHIRSGEDYISLPVIPAGNITSKSPDAIFGDDVEVWEWNATTQSWSRPDVMKAGTGYLIRCPEHRIVDIRGARAGTITWKDITENLKPGWNLIGPGDKNVEITDSRYVVVGWDGVDDTWVSLYKGDILKRGYGYWIYKTS